MIKSYPLFSDLSNIYNVSNQQFQEEERFVSLCQELLSRGDIPEHIVEGLAHRILDREEANNWLLLLVTSKLSYYCNHTQNNA